MAKKTTAPEDPKPNSTPLDEAQDNPNAATADESDQTNQDVQESQPRDAQPDTTASPKTDASETRDNGPTTPVAAGSADATADATADGQHNDTVNTHPQSALHRGKLSEDDKFHIWEESNLPGAVIGNIAEKYGVTSERVTEVIDEQNDVAPEDRD